MRWRPELDEILAAAGDGIHSVLEYRYLRDVERAHGLPQSRHQVRAVMGGKVPFTGTRTTRSIRSPSSLDGRMAHPDEERWRDRQREIKAGGAVGVVHEPLRMA